MTPQWFEMQAMDPMVAAVGEERSASENSLDHPWAMHCRNATIHPVGSALPRHLGELRPYGYKARGCVLVVRVPKIG